MSLQLPEERPFLRSSTSPLIVVGGVAGLQVVVDVDVDVDVDHGVNVGENVDVGVDVEVDRPSGPQNEKVGKNDHNNQVSHKKIKNNQVGHK